MYELLISMLASAEVMSLSASAIAAPPATLTVRPVVVSGASRTTVTGESYAYNTAPPPLPPTLALEAAQAGSRLSAHATRTWSSVSPRPQPPTPGQSLSTPGVQYYSSNQGVTYAGMNYEMYGVQACSSNLTGIGYTVAKMRS